MKGAQPQASCLFARYLLPFAHLLITIRTSPIVTFIKRNLTTQGNTSSSAGYPPANHQPRLNTERLKFKAFLAISGFFMRYSKAYCEVTLGTWRMAHTPTLQIKSAKFPEISRMKIDQKIPKKPQNLLYNLQLTYCLWFRTSAFTPMLLKPSR